jgi:hypothetical protein
VIPGDHGRHRNISKIAANLHLHFRHSADRSAQLRAPASEGGATEDAMKSTLIDATDVMRKALLGTDGGWYEAYWCTEVAETRRRLPARLAGRLAIAKHAIRVGHLGWTAAPGSARAGTASVPPALV